MNNDGLDTVRGVINGLLLSVAVAIIVVIAFWPVIEWAMK